MASDSARSTRQAAGPLNLKPNASKLEIRRNFFSQRVVADWNKIPVILKCPAMLNRSRKAMQDSENEWSALGGVEREEWMETATTQTGWRVNH
jgi:hypothetical protein